MLFVIFQKGFPWEPLNVPLTEEECNASKGFCPWRSCYIGYDTRNSDLKCTAELCLNENPGSSFCGYLAHPDFRTQPLGHDNICEVRALDAQAKDSDHNETLCYALGGTTFGGYSVLGNRPFTGCRTAAKSAAQCYEDFCIPNLRPNVTCQSYCQDTSRNEIACTGQTPQGYTRQWMNWAGMSSGAPMSACVLSSSYANCTIDGGTWVSGRLFLPELLNSPESCNSVCFSDLTGPDYLKSAAACAQKKCSSCSATDVSPSCSSESACTNTYSCDVTVGCNLPQNVNQLLGYNSGCTWTPKYCIQAIPKDFCGKISIAKGFQDPLLNQTACQQTEICNDGSNPNAIINKPLSLPAGFNMRNQTECMKCGGKMQPFWNWQQATWAATTFELPLDWVPNKINFPSWVCLNI